MDQTDCNATSSLGPGLHGKRSERERNVAIGNLAGDGGIMINVCLEKVHTGWICVKFGCN